MHDPVSARNCVSHFESCILEHLFNDVSHLEPLFFSQTKPFEIIYSLVYCYVDILCNHVCFLSSGPFRK